MAILIDQIFMAQPVNLKTSTCSSQHNLTSGLTKST